MGTIPTNKDLFGKADGDYHVCYRAVDRAGLAVHQTVAPVIHLDPSFVSGFTKLSNISDGYLNSVENVNSPLVSPLMAGAEIPYVVVATPSSTACNTIVDGSY